MKQYCRYCVNALDYNGEASDFLCNADAKCGNNGAGMFYGAEKAKRINSCEHFIFNENDIFGQDKNGNFKTYKPRNLKEKSILNQMCFEELEEI